MKNLTWDNYLELNDYIHKQGFKKEYFTPVVLIQWLFYDFELKYRLLDDAVVMYIYNKSDIEPKWSIYASYYKPNWNLNKAKEIIKKDMVELNGNDELNFLDFLQESFKDWDLDFNQATKSKWISNYIYEMDKMSTFAGKKLQKKRNHLNAFIKEGHNVKVKDIREVNLEEVLKFSEYHITKYAEDYRAYEQEVYKKYLLDEMPKDDRYFGTVVYIDDRIVGFTFGFINGDTFENIIEKAERDIRGLYQFVIVSNISFHHLTCKYMDREDDMGLEPLAKSKQSYYPIIAVERYNIHNKKDW